MIFVPLLAASLLIPCGTRPEGTAMPPSNYVYFGRDHERMVEPTFLDHPGIDGAQVKYTWRELEPDRDQLMPDFRYPSNPGKSSRSNS